jgi:hypothetical protein
MKFLSALFCTALLLVVPNQILAQSAANHSSIPQRITVACGGWFGCPSSAKQLLPNIQAGINNTVNSSCFKQFFKDRDALLIEKETHKRIDGHDQVTRKDVDQILSDLGQTDIHVKIWFYPFSKKACGKEGNPGSEKIPTSLFCWDRRLPGDAEKAGYVTHEISHKLGYHHDTAGNQEAGNEFTIPYSINVAFLKCYPGDAAVQ